MVRRALVALALTLALAGLFSFAGCTAILGDFEVTGTPLEGGTGTAEGQACQGAGECASGSCSDGICCESACDGICEKCNLPGSVGKCIPVPDGDDPENECPTTPLPDAGPDDDAGIVLDDGGLEDAEVDGGAVPEDAGPTFALPDAGITTEQNQCAGKCNGKRACHYPAAERTCGTVVCGNATQQGRASCDGNGHCLFGIEECAAYSCPDGSPGCKTTCTGESDCLPTHFCDAQSSTCKPKLSNGSACLSVAQCQSSFCVSNVCCNDSCNGFEGASCTVPGSVGQCRCNACPGGGTCQLYYRDRDGDGFGDKYGTVANGNATPYCVTGPAPAGFVANNDDCLDGPPQAPYFNVHPNQTGWFNQPYTHPVSGLPTFDYDCNDQIAKETPEYPNATGCGFCKAAGVASCNVMTTCAVASQAAGLGCTIRICPIGQSCPRCVTDTRPGFLANVDCGVTRARHDCGSCPTAGTLATGNTTAQVQQRCR